MNMLITQGGVFLDTNKIWDSFIEEIKKPDKQAKLDMFFSDYLFTSSGCSR